VEQEKACSDTARLGGRQGRAVIWGNPWEAASEYPLPSAPADRLVVVVKVL
jgi:hypothetical protein